MIFSNPASAGWQVTLCDPIWHVSSSSGEACCELLYPVTLLTTTYSVFNIESLLLLSLYSCITLRQNYWNILSCNLCDSVLVQYLMPVLLCVVCEQADMMTWGQCWRRVSDTTHMNHHFISIMPARWERLVNIRTVKDIFFLLSRKVEVTVQAFLVIMQILVFCSNICSRFRVIFVHICNGVTKHMGISKITWVAYQT